MRYYLLAVAVILTLPVLVMLSAPLRNLVSFLIVFWVFAYYNHAWLSTLIKKIRVPKFRRLWLVVWSVFAIFGVFVFGFIFGSTAKDFNQNDNTITNQNTKDAQMTDVLNNYQGLSKLFYLQQQDMDIITDSSKWTDNPQELSDAIQSYKQKKDEILFQWGRLYELRKKAGLADDPNLHAD